MNLKDIISRLDINADWTKPDNIVEKMVTGKMRKYYEENVLVNQKSVVFLF